MFQTQRRHPRYTARLKVHLEDAGSVIDAFTANISRGGLFLESERPLEIGESVRLQLFLPEGRRLEIEGCVAHRGGHPDADASKGAAPGVGVEFIKLSLADRRALMAYVEELSEAMRNAS